MCCSAGKNNPVFGTQRNVQFVLAEDFFFLLSSTMLNIFKKYWFEEIPWNFPPKSYVSLWTPEVLIFIVTCSTSS